MTDLQNAQYTLSSLYLEISLLSDDQFLLKRDSLIDKIFHTLHQIDNARKVYEPDEIIGQDPGIQVSEAHDVI